jgi:hypothetical protein
VDTTRGEGDHVVPSALGRFRGEFRFRRICRKCNEIIGRCEEQILRTAPEAYVRRLAQPITGRSKRGSSWVGAHGAPAPKFMVAHDDHYELAEGSPDNPQNVRAVDQLVLVGRDGRQHHIKLHARMTLDQLKLQIDRAGAGALERSYLHSDDATWPIYTDLMGKIWPGTRVVEAESREAGVHQVVGVTRFVFTDDYWRAIAKIAFHYVLVNSKRGLVGSELEFAPLRDFIMKGGSHQPFFEGPGARFVTGFGELARGGALLPDKWSHLLAADESVGEVSAAVCLFMGPQRVPTVRHVHLGRLGSLITVPDAMYVHVYIYDTVLEAEGYAGRVESESLRRLG